MPLKVCELDGRPGVKWGDSGKCYTYTQGDDRSRRKARRRAINQGIAIEGPGQVQKELAGERGEVAMILAEALKEMAMEDLRKVRVMYWMDHQRNALYSRMKRLENATDEWAVGWMNDADIEQSRKDGMIVEPLNLTNSYNAV